MPVPEVSTPGRPGSATFTIEGRQAPALFVVGWLATLLGLGAILVAVLSGGGAAAPILLAVGLVLLSIGLIAGAGSQGIERRARARMAGIARMVALFARRYNELGVTPATREAFLRDLEVIASLLGDRIALEETALYALYQPPHRAGELPDEDCLLGLESPST